MSSILLLGLQVFMVFGIISSSLYTYKGIQVEYKTTLNDALKNGVYGQLIIFGAILIPNGFCYLLQAECSLNLALLMAVSFVLDAIALVFFGLSYLYKRSRNKYGFVVPVVSMLISFTVLEIIHSLQTYTGELTQPEISISTGLIGVALFALMPLSGIQFIFSGGPNRSAKEIEQRIDAAVNTLSYGMLSIAFSVLLATYFYVF